MAMFRQCVNGALGAVLLASSAWAAAPSRSRTYTTGQTIEAGDVTSNEDQIFSYLQAGVDTYAAGSVNAAAIGDGAVGASELATDAVDVVDMIATGTKADDKAFVADSSSAGTWRTLPNCTDTGGQHLNYTQSTNSFSCGTSGTTTVADRAIRTAGDVTTTSTSLVDLTGMSVTLTTGANPALVTFIGSCRNSDVGDGIDLNVQLDDTTLVLGTQGYEIRQHATSEAMGCAFSAMTADLTAASHTFDIQWRVISAGTATMQCDGTFTCQMSVEEVTD